MPVGASNQSVSHNTAMVTTLRNHSSKLSQCSLIDTALEAPPHIVMNMGPDTPPQIVLQIVLHIRLCPVHVTIRSESLFLTFPHTLLVSLTSLLNSNPPETSLPVSQTCKPP